MPPGQWEKELPRTYAHLVIAIKLLNQVSIPMVECEPGSPEEELHSDLKSAFHDLDNLKLKLSNLHDSHFSAFGPRP